MKAWLTKAERRAPGERDGGWRESLLGEYEFRVVMIESPKRLRQKPRGLEFGGGPERELGKMRGVVR